MSTHLIYRIMVFFYLSAALLFHSRLSAESCELQVVNARAGELWPIPGKTSESWRVAFQGNAHPDYAAIVDAFGVEYLDHWRSVPARDGHARDYPPVTARLRADGSVRLLVDCGRPFLHHGYDAAGNRVASGLMPMAAMGVMVCRGCHLHSEERAAILGDAAERFARTAAGKGL